MKLDQVQELLQADMLTSELAVDMDFVHVKASDLMSDVLTGCDCGALLVTGLTNAQAIRTAQVVDAAAILFVRGKRPTDDIVAMAKQRNLPLLTTKLPMFETCGILFKNGMKGT